MFMSHYSYNWRQVGWVEKVWTQFRALMTLRKIRKLLNDEHQQRLGFWCHWEMKMASILVRGGKELINSKLILVSLPQSSWLCWIMACVGLWRLINWINSLALRGQPSWKSIPIPICKKTQRYINIGFVNGWKHEEILEFSETLSK